MTTVELEHDGGWALELDAVRRELRSETRAIVVNFPHNPTGAHIDRATLEGLVELAADAGAHLFSDEVYRWLEHPPEAPLPGAAELSPHALSLGVMSKTFALPGCASAGWPAATATCSARSRRSRLHDDLRRRAERGPRAHRAAPPRRSRRPQPRDRRRQPPPARRVLRPVGGRFEWARPRGAAIGFPRLAADVAIDDFARELVDEEGVLILPGSVYEHAGNHFRLGFGRRNMPEALQRLERFAGARL